MVTPPASSKPRFLEKVAGSTLMLCHAFPQERPTGRSGTASAGSGKSAEAEVPSFSRNGSCASAVFSPPVRRRFYQPVDALSIGHMFCSGAVAPFAGLSASAPGEALRRPRCGCYTRRLACRKAKSPRREVRCRPVAQDNSGDSHFICCNDQTSRSGQRPHPRHYRAMASGSTSGRSAAR